MAEAAAETGNPARTWPVLERSLQSQRDGRLVLAELGRDVESGAESLREWLEGPGAPIVTLVQGGTVERLVNIARAEVVNIYQQPLSLPVPRQLPPDLRDFSDRKELLARIKDSLFDAGATPEILAISGSGGCGKTSLAVHAAYLVRKEFTDGQLYVDLRGQSGSPLDAYDVLAGLLRAFGFGGPAIPREPGEREGLFRSLLAERRVLIILDNAGSEGQLRPLLPGGTGPAVLITSRRQMIGLEGVFFVRLKEFSDDDSLVMLSSIIGADRCERQRADAEEIARLCGGLPLAVRLAGTRLAASELLPLGTLASALGDESRRLQELSVGDREVRATLKLSYDRRPEQEQGLFRLLATLDVQSFRSWVAASLMDSTLEQAESLLSGLVDNQLLAIAQQDADGTLRYRFHDLMRALARELANADPKTTRHRGVDRVMNDYCQLAEFHAAKLAPGGYFEIVDHRDGAAHSYPGRIQAILDRDSYQWFSAEYPTLRWAIEHCAAEGWLRYAWRLALAVQDFLELQGNLKDWHHLAQVGLRAAEQDHNRKATALSRRSLGIALLYQGAGEDAVRELRRALIPGGRRGPDKTRAVTLRSLGEALSETGQWDEARVCFTEATQVFARLGLPEWAAWTEWSLGVAQGVHGDTRGAVNALQESIRRFEQLHHVRGLAVTLRSLSIAETHLGRNDQASSSLEQCIPLFRATGDRLGEALAMKQLAELYSDAGRGTEAAELRAVCEPYLQQVGGTADFH
jgi:tetratricopeptide (TPR) repeat protein